MDFLKTEKTYKDHPRRKQIRLTDYDYSNPGGYFITVCTANRRNAFWSDRMDGSLSDAGRIAEQEMTALPERFRHIKIDKYAIMPDHIHMILTLAATLAETGEKLPSIRSVVASFKAKVTGKICRGGHDRPSVWQKSFYDHVIRNEHDYASIWEYIDNNPRKYLENKGSPDF